MAPVCRLVATAAVALNTPNLYPDPGPTGINNMTLMHLVRENAHQVSTRSWELGTLTEALLEYQTPSLSVFNTSAFPPPYTLTSAQNASASDVLTIATSVVSEIPADSLTLMVDGAVGDPASIGVAVLLANWTKADLTDGAYSTAAGHQLDYLLNYAPRTDTGAISHRADEAQLWADFVYMAPPFIAYFGSLAGGDSELSLIQTAYDQISLYRDVLRDDSGLWRHIMLGSWSDETHWGTGNAWAAAGMLRVLMTMNHTAQAESFAEQSANLALWINEILESSWAHQTDSGAVRNVIDDATTFEDSASTALLAAVTYRMAAFGNDSSLISHADRATEHVVDQLDVGGWLHNTVDPYVFSTPSEEGSFSPEGQSFVLLLRAAYRDWNSSVV